MDTGPERIIFNRYRLPDNVADDDFYSNDPVVVLTAIAPKERGLITRNQKQLAILQSKNQTVDDPVFGTTLEWAYRGYVVEPLPPPAGVAATGEGGAPGGPLPPGSILAQPVRHAARREQLESVRAGYATQQKQPKGTQTAAASDTSDATPSDRWRLCLFSVIVALEWYPDQPYMRQLEWAFRRASDFLYDVTDGRMAFGQVVFSGPDLMDCADIQIMASNRLLPRSWVSGLHEPNKYLPIRVGRGTWHKNNHITIPWDEPEAYRTLIHEWGHYALELLDEYLEKHHVFLCGQAGLTSAPDQLLGRGIYSLMVPKISLTVESIMATLEGTSELVPSRVGSRVSHKQNQWDTIKRKGRYRFLAIDPGAQPLDGPEQLPLPLPTFHRLGRLASPGAPRSKGTRSSAPPQQSDALYLSDFPKGVQLDHCWVYVLQGKEADPSRIIAQGTLDARSQYDGFRLLGAGEGDTVVLVGSDYLGRSTVHCGLIQDFKDKEARIKGWRLATPAAGFPIVDVLPEPSKSGDLRAQIKVRVICADGQAAPKNVWVFPLGQVRPEDIISFPWDNAADWTSPERDVTTLDGHVMVRWDDNTLLISTLSQGGGPSTTSPHAPPPITSGSSEGNLMLFFENKDQNIDYSDIRVITTLVHGVRYELQNGAQARSYAFSLASNQPLPLDLSPTLIMYYDRDAAGGNGDLLIHRHMGDERWEPIPTYLPPGSSFAAAPLNTETASGLVALAPEGQRVERYRIYYVPRGAPGGKSEASPTPTTTGGEAGT